MKPPRPLKSGKPRALSEAAPVGNAAPIGKAAAPIEKARVPAPKPQAVAARAVETSRPLRVLGLDPGSVRTGWGVVEGKAPSIRGVSAGVIRVSEKAPLPERLHEIHRGVESVLREYRPDAVAVEDIFFARYPQAALILGHARGVALLAVSQAGLSVSAYPPTLVKRAVVGSGRAEKAQVAQLVGALLGLKELPAVDATDALAVAITHFNVMRMGV